MEPGTPGIEVAKSEWRGLADYSGYSAQWRQMSREE